MQHKIEFAKYQGTGNDFIIINAFDKDIKLSPQNIQEMCHRRFGIGADGLMILKRKEHFDFEMDFYNSDGFPGSMCGNGGRCIVAFAHDVGIIDEKTQFYAPDGAHEAIFTDHDNVSLKMSTVEKIETHSLGVFMDTGSPHLVITKKNDSDLDVFHEGKTIRYSAEYRKEGVNVNFLIPSEQAKIYTYERGVENETYSCGTGTVAAAISYHLQFQKPSPIVLTAKGGKLKVHFTNNNKGVFSNIWLEGPAKKSFDGLYMLT